MSSFPWLLLNFNLSKCTYRGLCSQNVMTCPNNQGSLSFQEFGYKIFWDFEGEFDSSSYQDIHVIGVWIIKVILSCDKNNITICNIVTAFLLTKEMIVWFSFIFECEPAVRYMVEVLEPFKERNSNTASIDVQIWDHQDVTL